jgi:hypothetical protein
MSTAYPHRQMLSSWLRYVCMAFGIACAISAFGLPNDPFVPNGLIVAGGIVIGVTWFAFGLYGGLPLFNTTSVWHPPASPDEVNSLHREGLLVIRRRRWLMWAAFASMFTVLPFMALLLLPSDNGMYLIAGVWLLLLIITYRYFLSRCPRCGFGFFTLSMHRAAPVWFRSSCAHCKLSLVAYQRGE